MALFVAALALGAAAAPSAGGATASELEAGEPVPSARAKRETAATPCKLAGRAPCARLVRSTSRGKATPGQRRSVSGRRVTRRAGAVVAGNSIYVRLDMNAASRGRTALIFIRKIPGLTTSTADIRLRGRGFTKCVRRARGPWIIIGCRRSRKRASAQLLIQVEVPFGTTATGFRAVAWVSGTKSRQQVLSRIQRAVQPPPRPEPLGNVSAALCPTPVTVNGEALVLVSAETFNPARPDANTSGSFACRYESPPQPGRVPTRAGVDLTYLRQRGNRNRFCGIPLSPGSQYRNSLTHEIQVFVSDHIDGADGLRTTLLANLEAANIGVRC